MPNKPQNRIKQELQVADRSYAWLARQMQKRGFRTTRATVRSWAANYTQPSVGQAAVISDILKIPIYRLVQQERGQSIQDEMAKDSIDMDKLDRKFKK